jgi:hypothetical protein
MPLALSNSVKELLVIFFIVLIPTLPVTFFGWTLLSRRRRGRSEEIEIETGRSPATPFAVISVVGSVIAVAAFFALLLAVLARAIAA